MEYLLEPICMEEDQIIEKLKSSGIDKRKAEDQLFDRFSYFVRVAETKYNLSGEELLDAYSDAVLAVIHSVTQGLFKNRSSLKTFIYEIYHNKCVDIIRKKATKKNTIYKTETISELQSSLSDHSISIIEKLIERSDLENIKQKMNYLSGKNKEVLLLSVDGYSDKEIAVITNFKTADVVKTCRLRCIKKLKQLVS